MKTKNSTGQFFGIAFCAILTAGTALNLDAANFYWTADDGNWGNAANWDLGSIPQPADRAYFRVGTGGSEAAVVNVSVAAGEHYSQERLLIWQGKTVNLQMGNNSSLTTTNITGLGTRSSADPKTAARLNISGPLSGTASVSLAQIQIGQAGDNPEGNLLSVGGQGLTVNATAVTVGRFADANQMVVSGGASVNASYFVVAGNGGVADGMGNNNNLLVTGSGTTVVTNNASNTDSLGLVVATRGGTGLSETQMQHGNTVTVNEGASFRILGNGTTQKQLQIGAASYRHSNAVTVSGSGSVLELVKQGGEVGIVVGGENGYTWNNSLTVSDGALLRSDGAATVAGRNAVNPQNRIEVAAGGTFHSAGNIGVSGGLLRLEQGGVLVGKNTTGQDVAIEVNVSAHTGTGGLTGRFEAEGDGLGDNVTVNLRERGVLAVGVEGGTEAAVLVLNSTMNFFNDSILELGIYGANAIDSIHLGNTGYLNLNANVDGLVTLSLLVDSAHDFSVGDTYQLFTGNIEGVSGSFSEILLPTLSGELTWDLSQFNAAGGWSVAVVPEPSQVVLWALVSLGFVVVVRRGRR